MRMSPGPAPPADDAKPMHNGKPLPAVLSALRQFQRRYLHSWSRWKKAWDAFVMLLVAYCSFEIPLRFSVMSYVPTGVAVFGRFVDSLFWLDIVLNFFTGVQDQWGQMMFDPAFLARRYVKGWFVVDVFASLPLEVAFGPSGRLVRMLRIGRVFRKMDELTASARTYCPLLLGYFH
jgi:potassium voltage-gated channel Eag-related subfamily H protein 8